MAKRMNRWQRLLKAHRDRGPWLTSWQQLMAIGSTTPSKVRSEARANGIRWMTRKDANGHIEYRPVRTR